MEKRYNQEYEAVIKKLNQAFNDTQDEPDRARKMTEPLTVNKSSQSRGSISAEESKLIQSKLKPDVQKIEYLSKLPVASGAGTYRNLNYKVLTWKLTGQINMKEIMDSYTKLIQSNEVYHSVYLYKQLSQVVKVVYEVKNMTFPVHDIRSVKKDRVSLLLKGIVAAELRREYRSEIDYPFGIKGFITEDDEMIVVASIYPYFMYPSGVREMMMKIFANMKLENTNIGYVDSNTLKKVHDLQEMTLKYWRNELADCGKELIVPGENLKNHGMNAASEERVVVQKQIPEDMVVGMKKFMLEKNVSQKSILIYAWAKVLGGYNDEKAPVLLVSNNSDILSLVPVKVETGMSDGEELLILDKKLEKVKHYVNCTREDIEKETNVMFAKQFHMLQDFSAIESKDIEQMAVENVGINLSVSYQVENGAVSVLYVSRGGFFELILENLHDMFLDALSWVIKEEKEHFDKNNFIKADDTNGQKLEKIRLAQIALYLKNSGIFSTFSVDEIMKLSEYCTLQSYLQDDEVCGEGVRENMFYIIGDGKLEESRMNLEGMVNSIRIAKPGNVFGIESLFDGKTYQSTYMVVSEQAKIVGIDCSILKEVLRRKPDGWITLLQMENEQKCKLQRLWMMN